MSAFGPLVLSATGSRPSFGGEALGQKGGECDLGTLGFCRGAQGKGSVPRSKQENTMLWQEVPAQVSAKQRSAPVLSSSTLNGAQQFPHLQAHSQGAAERSGHATPQPSKISMMAHSHSKGKKHGKPASRSNFGSPTKGQPPHLLNWLQSALPQLAHTTTTQGEKRRAW